MHENISLEISEQAAKVIQSEGPQWLKFLRTNRDQLASARGSLHVDDGELASKLADADDEIEALEELLHEINRVTDPLYTQYAVAHAVWFTLNRKPDGTFYNDEEKLRVVLQELAANGYIVTMEQRKEMLLRQKGEIWSMRYPRENPAEEPDMEFFSGRPQTPGVTGDWEDWPETYEVRVGNVDGGDTKIIEIAVAGQLNYVDRGEI